MRAGRDFHLTYCSNIHAGESWNEVSAALAHALPLIRGTLGETGPLGIGLRLSAAAAETLEQPAQLEAFRDFLAQGHYYVFTINGFPYGAFHGTRVKEQVYLPDWRDAARVDYSDGLARLLAALLEGHPGIDGTVSTVPGAFRSTSRRRADARAIAGGILRHVRALRDIHDRTGQSIRLALEPEPACFLESIDDAVVFFREYLFDTGVARAADLDVDTVRRHLGLCLDTCHMAVEFEDPADVFRRLEAEQISIGKVQISSAIRVASPRANPGAIEALRKFADDVYLHQVVACRQDGCERHTDLPGALASPGTVDADEWRVHFHVPLFLETLPPLETTQAYVREVIALLKQNHACPYLEVETYTWDVLPPEYRTTDVSSAIARELRWVREQLEA